MAAFKCSVVLVFCWFGASAQVNRYMVFFSDKNGSPFSIASPEDFLSGKSLTRRAKQLIPVTEDDLPVNPSYIAQVKGTGARIFYSSRWMNGVLVEIGADSISLLQALPPVSRVDLVAPGHRLTGGRLKKRSPNARRLAGVNQPQLQQLGLDDMQQQGFHGEGMTIAILDAGFPGVDSAASFQNLRQGQLKASYNFVLNSKSVYQSCNGCEHGTEVLSVMAAQSATYTGAAYGAQYYLFVTEDDASEYRVEEYNWVFAAERADSAGVDIINTSLGYNVFDDPSMNYTPADMDGHTAVITRGATFAIARGMVLVCAAGNEGESPDPGWNNLIIAPADAVGILSCGAVTISGARAPFSSVGPTADNRIKPEVSALGFGDVVVSPENTTILDDGTSFASPLVASLAAGVWQALPGISSADLYQAILRSSSHAFLPDNFTGYGIPQFAAVKSYLESREFVSVYPNPAPGGFVNLSFKYGGASGTVSITDFFGRTLSEQSMTLEREEYTTQCDISMLPNGLYIMKIKTGEGATTVRLIKRSW
jgi:serine protease AprX